MKNVLIIILVALLALAGGVIVYLVMSANKAANNTTAPTGPSTSNTETVMPTTTPEYQPASQSTSTGTATGQSSSTNQQNINLSQLITKDKFTLQVPSDWANAQMTQGAYLTMAKTDEQITDAAAKKLNFKTYVSIVYDNSSQISLENYASALESSLKQSVPGITFTELSPVSINGRQAKVVASSFSQQGVNLKVLSFLIGGNNKDIWLILFDTLPEKWNEYQNLFYAIAGSFKLK